MNAPSTDSIWLNDTDVCRIDYLVEVSGLSIEEIEDLVDIGVITPAIPEADQRLFHLECVITVKTARRLRDDFQLDLHGVALALTLLQRIGELEEELKASRARTGRTP